VESGTPGFVVERHIDSLDQTFLGGHCEVRFTGCRVGPEAVLGEVDEGFAYAQVRLAPARLTHCMRWLGLARRANRDRRPAGLRADGEGKPLAEHQMVQQLLADSAIDLHAARLMIWHAAWVLDAGGPAARRRAWPRCSSPRRSSGSSTARIQVCGSLGVSDDLPLGLFYREVRPFRIYDGPSRCTARHRAAPAPGPAGRMAETP
jgi:alkylation response protein AidB-like acyl-CoA dehydrogenase